MKNRPLSPFPLHPVSYRRRFSRNKSFDAYPRILLLRFFSFKAFFFKFSFICLDLYIAFVLVYFFIWKENLLSTHNSYLSERYPYTHLIREFATPSFKMLSSGNLWNALTHFSITLLRLVIDDAKNITFHTLNQQNRFGSRNKSNTQNSHSQTKSKLHTLSLE